MSSDLSGIPVGVRHYSWVPGLMMYRDNGSPADTWYYKGLKNYKYYIGGSFRYSIQYNGPQNPILNITAPTLHG